MHNNAKETKTFNVNQDNNNMNFENEFEYLGTIINYMTNNTVQIIH